MKIKRKLNESKHRYQGRSDAFEGRWNCREEKGSDAHRDYFEGFQEGLREAFGADDHDMLEQTMAPNNMQAAANQQMTTPPPAQPMQPTAAPAAGATTPGSTTQPTAALEETMFLNELGDEEEELERDIDDIIDRAVSDADKDDIHPLDSDTELDTELDLDGIDDLDEVSRGEWIKQQDSKAEASGKKSFRAFGQTFNTDEVTEDDEPMVTMESIIRQDAMMNAWNTQLMNLLNEARGKKCDCDCNPCECDTTAAKKTDKKKPVKEGMTVTTTMGNDYGPDSLNINATDEDAHELMRILKHSGISVGLGSADDDYDHEEDYGDEYEDETCGDSASDDDVVGGYKELPAMTSPRGMMMSQQAKPAAAMLSLQPKSAVGFDDVLGGLMESKELDSLLFLSGQKKKLMENSPSGSGMMSKSASDKEAKPNQPTDQKAIMGTLKPAKIDNNSSLERLQKSHDAGPVDSKTGKRVGKSEPKSETKSEKAVDDNSASLSEALANDLYKIYAIAEDASTDTVSGYKKVSTMAMPRGMGMSVQAEDEPQDIIEPADVEDVMKALDQGAPEPVKFPKLEKLMKAHMPDVEDPKIMPKGEESETAKITGPIDDMSGGHSHEGDFENEVKEDEHEEKKVEEGREMCSECGGIMEDDHQCEEKEQLEEWANDQGRHGTDEAQLMDTEYMVDTNSGGLNGRNRDQTTLPHTEVKVRDDADLAHWLRLSGLR